MGLSEAFTFLGILQHKLFTQIFAEDAGALKFCSSLSLYTAECSQVGLELHGDIISEYESFRVL